jgi:hypothetical protein
LTSQEEQGKMNITIGEKFLMNIKTCIIIVSILLFSPVLIHAESIRGPLVDEIEIEGVGDFKKQIQISPSEMVFLSIGSNERFLKGLRVEIVMSNILKPYADSFAVEIYSQVTPSSPSSEGEYHGKRILFEVLPFLNTIYLEIPLGLEKVNTGYLPPGTYSPSREVEPGHFPLLFTIQPVMKGVPDSVLSKKFYINIEPEVEKKGFLELFVTKPQGFEDQEYEVFIDDEVMEQGKGEFILDSGIHQLKVVSAHFKEETTSFSIESGKTTKVDLLLERSISVLMIDIIEEAVIFIDGERINVLSGEGYHLAAGMHTILIKVGTQTITKKIDIRSGKRYNMSLIFDIEIKEN